MLQLLSRTNMELRLKLPVLHPHLRGVSCLVNHGGIETCWSRRKWCRDTVDLLGRAIVELKLEKLEGSDCASAHSVDWFRAIVELTFVADAQPS